MNLTARPFAAYTAVCVLFCAASLASPFHWIAKVMPSDIHHVYNSSFYGCLLVIGLLLGVQREERLWRLMYPRCGNWTFVVYHRSSNSGSAWTQFARLDHEIPWGTFPMGSGLRCFLRHRTFGAPVGHGSSPADAHTSANRRPNAITILRRPKCKSSVSALYGAITITTTTEPMTHKWDDTSRAYAYVGGNPVSLRDPLGLWSITAAVYIGPGVEITIGSDAGRAFLTGRVGIGIGVGVGFDLNGKIPGPDVSESCRGGIVLGASVKGDLRAGRSTSEPNLVLQETTR